MDGEAFVDERCEESSNLVGRDFLQALGGSWAVDGVGHKLTRMEQTHDVEHGQKDFGIGGIEVGTAQKTPLEDEVALELL